MIRTKICGLSTSETVAAAVRHGADYVGFVHFSKSPRHVDLDQARVLATPFPKQSVLLLVDPDICLLGKAIEIVRPAVVQLHGQETPDFLAEIKRRHDVALWKAIPIRTRADLNVVQAYAGLVDMILFDAKPPAGSQLPGGNGLRFDWELLRDYRSPVQWGVSGGLDPANVGEAMRISKPSLLDVSSGVEDGPGQKNVDKMAAFLKAVRQ